MLYTIIPSEQIFAASPDGQGNPPTEAIILWNGRQVVCQRDPQGEWRLTRLLSTDPNDFLDPRWQPGTIVRGF